MSLTTVQQLCQMLMRKHEDLMERYENKEVPYYVFYWQLRKLNAEINCLRSLIEQSQAYEAELSYQPRTRQKKGSH